jgi:hypothetical protein
MGGGVGVWGGVGGVGYRIILSSLTTPLPYTNLSHIHKTQQLLARKQGILLMILIAKFPIETVQLPFLFILYFLYFKAIKSILRVLVTVNLPLNIIPFLAMKDLTVVTVFWDVKSIVICCMTLKKILKETKKPS